MDAAFLGIPRGSRQPAYDYSVPAHRQQPARSPKVVSAARIQAVFRGFVVRKCVKKLDVVRREVEEIERRICEETTAELIRRDERERLKVNESLMSLLFRLDSVRGVDAGVRDFRKTVIWKAIALQERVDAIAAAAGLSEHKDGGGAAGVEKSEEGAVDSSDLPDRDKGKADADQIDKQVTDFLDQGEGCCVDARGEEQVLDSPDREKEGYNEAERREDLGIDLPDSAEARQIEESDHVDDSLNDTCDLSMQTEPSQCESSGESKSDPSLIPESLLEEVDVNAPTKGYDGTGQERSTEEKKTNNRNEEMIGRMMEENEKMMTQLSERNERQTQLLSLLSQRVERLEKAFLCEKLRRKRKREREAGDGDRLQK